MPTHAVYDDSPTVALLYSMMYATSSVTYVDEAREMGDSKAPTRSAKASNRAPSIGMGTVKPAAKPKNADRIGGRHTAITNNLKNLTSYKSWVEKIRGTWQDEK